MLALISAIHRASLGLDGECLAASAKAVHERQMKRSGHSTQGFGISQTCTQITGCLYSNQGFGKITN